MSAADCLFILLGYLFIIYFPPYFVLSGFGSPCVVVGQFFYSFPAHRFIFIQFCFLFPYALLLPLCLFRL